MERMGLNLQEIPDVKEVVIKTASKELIVRGASVSEIRAKGVRVFQVTGSEVEEKQIEKPKFREEDVILVSQQAGVSRERAIAALEECNGDLAQSILKLTT